MNTAKTPRRIPPTRTSDAPRTDTLILASLAPIVSLTELSDISRSLRSAGKRIVHCHGAFDLLHPGHLKHFIAAKAMGDVLIVTLTADRFIRKGPGRPVFTEQLRAESLAALRAVDFVAIAPYPTGVEAIAQVQPHLYVKGQDYADRSKDVNGVIAAEEAAAVRFGGKLVFTHEIQFSSTRLLQQPAAVLSDE